MNDAMQNNTLKEASGTVWQQNIHDRIINKSKRATSVNNNLMFLNFFSLYKKIEQRIGVIKRTSFHLQNKN